MLKLKFIGYNTGIYDNIFVTEITHNKHTLVLKTSDTQTKEFLSEWFESVCRWKEDCKYKISSPFYDFKKNITIGCDLLIGCFPVFLHHVGEGDKMLTECEFKYDLRRTV